MPTNVLPIPPRYNISNESSKNIDSRGTTKKPKIEEIYRADDLQNHRMSELEVRLKEKQEEMDTMLNNKKPTSIDFSDSSLNDNNNSKRWKKVALEFDGPHHFTVLASTNAKLFAVAAA